MTNSIVVYFAGDSGDGMQLSGYLLALSAIADGQHLVTFSDYPAEIRAPQGTVGGVSGLQLHLAKEIVYSPGDLVEVLVVMNPAALKVSLSRLKQQGILILDRDAFNEAGLKKAGYEQNPLNEALKEKYRVIDIPLTTLTLNLAEQINIAHSLLKKTKNMFALGVLCFLCAKKLDAIKSQLSKKFKHNPDVVKANYMALEAGYHYADTLEMLDCTFNLGVEVDTVKKVHMNGNQAFAKAMAYAAINRQEKLLFTGYPITPASSILQYAAKYQDNGIMTFQAEDEIASITATLGAAYGGGLAVCATSGPGLDLKAEALGYAVMAELPMVLINVQRAGPSTGLPTKTEQSDLFAAMFGRHGEAPIAVFAPATVAECFTLLLDAFYFSQKYRTPVIVLSDAYLASSSQTFVPPVIDDLPDLSRSALASSYIVPGTPGQQDCLGGLERDEQTQEISYDGDNHALKVDKRAKKMVDIAFDLPPAQLEADVKSDCVVVSWGSTYGAVKESMGLLSSQGCRVAHIHLRHINPFPQNLKILLSRFKKIIVPELNKGQLLLLLKANFSGHFVALSCLKGRPFLVEELVSAIKSHVEVVL